jgi:hypothetical protein
VEGRGRGGADAKRWNLKNPGSQRLKQMGKVLLLSIVTDRGNHENQRISEFRVKSKRCPYWLERNQVSGQDVTEWNRYRDEECLLAIESFKKGKK